MKMAERPCKEGEDLLGQCRVDPLLQQHDLKVALRRRHDDTVAVVLILAELLALSLPFAFECVVAAMADHFDDVLRVETLALLALAYELVLVHHQLDCHLGAAGVFVGVLVRGPKHDRGRGRMLGCVG